MKKVRIIRPRLEEKENPRISEHMDSLDYLIFFRLALDMAMMSIERSINIGKR